MDASEIKMLVTGVALGFAAATPFMLWAFAIARRHGEIAQRQFELATKLGGRLAKHKTWLFQRDHGDTEIYVSLAVVANGAVIPQAVRAADWAASTIRKAAQEAWEKATLPVRENEGEKPLDHAGNPADEAPPVGDHLAAPLLGDSGDEGAVPRVDVMPVKEPVGHKAEDLRRNVVERVVVDDRAAADARKDGVGFLIHAEDSTKDHPGHASGRE